MSQLFDTPTVPTVVKPPAPPQVSSAVVQNAANDARKVPGRASQFFSDPQANLTAGPSRKQYLGGVV